MKNMDFKRLRAMPQREVEEILIEFVSFLDAIQEVYGDPNSPLRLSNYAVRRCNELLSLVVVADEKETAQ